MKKVLFVLIISMLVLSCATYSPSYAVNRFGRTNSWTRETLDGTYEYSTMVIVPLGGSFSNDDKLALQVGNIFLDGVLQGHFFAAEYHGTGWAFIESISMKIDDVEYTFTDNNPTRTVRSGNYVIEKLFFPLTETQVNELTDSSKITAQLYGRVVTIEDDDLRNVQDFLTSAQMH